MAFHISITDTNAYIVREYENGIKIEGSWVVGLKSFVSYNMIPNICPENKNNTFQLINPITKQGCLLTIPTGVYELEDLFKFICNSVCVKELEPDLKLQLNKNTLKVSMFSNNCVIDVPPPTDIRGSVCTLFGFTSAIIYEPSITHVAPRNVDIFSINTIKIRCNLIKGNYNNLEHGDNSLYEFPLNSEVGEKIIERPNTIAYYPVFINTIYTLVISIVDQEDNLINFQGERISLILEFKKVN